jgi:PAS domain S-box-containing protein
MSGSNGSLAAFIRTREAEIVAIWERIAAVLPGEGPPSSRALRDDVHGVLHAIADRLEVRAPPSEAPPAVALSLHALQRAELASTLLTITGEILAVRDAIEEAWLGGDSSGDRASLLALRHACEAVLLAALEQFVRLRFGLLASIDEIVRAYDPRRALGATLEGMLRVLHRSIAGIDTVAVLLRDDDDVLRCRAAVGLEEEARCAFAMPVGQGFAGVVAAERQPRLLRTAGTDPTVLSPFLRAAGVRALYGVPLVSSGELLGVAHMGSLTADDFSEESKVLFRAIVARLVGVIHQHVLNERLEVERSRYRSIFDNAPAIIYSKDRDGRYLAINRRGLVDLGLTPEAFLGRTDDAVFPAEVADAIRRSDRRVIDQRTEIEHEEAVHLGGEPRWYLTTKFPIVDARGRVTGVGGVSTDITERRRREHGQSLLSDVGALLASSLDYVASLSRLAERVVGELADLSLVYLIDDEGEIQKPLVAHRDPAKADLARRSCPAIAEGGRPNVIDAVLRSREILHMARVPEHYLDTMAQDQDHRELMRALDIASMIQVPLVARDQLLGVWVLVRGPKSGPYDELDVYLARELGARVSLAVDNARLYWASRRAIQARDEVLGVVAHDLRTPLGTIVLAAEGMLGSLDPSQAEAHRRVQAIQRAAAHMDKLVEDLLDQQAIERGRLEISPRSWPARLLVDDVAEEHASRIEAASLSLELALPATLPEIHADRDRVRQVFGNLLANALKFTPPGGRITLGARLRDDDVCFFVRDTGTGMTPDAMRHLFDRYWQARREDRRGVGLGLAIAKGIVEAHGGTIWATSTPGEGTTVQFTLPRAHEDASASPRLH